MEPNHINKTLAEMMGWTHMDSCDGPNPELRQDYWRDDSEGPDVVGVMLQRDWNPATDANHLNQCIVEAAKWHHKIIKNGPFAKTLWRKFCAKIRMRHLDHSAITVFGRDELIGQILLLPTLTLATLLCEAYEETR